MIGGSMDMNGDLEGVFTRFEELRSMEFFGENYGKKIIERVKANVKERFGKQAVGGGDYGQKITNLIADISNNDNLSRREKDKAYREFMKSDAYKELFRESDEEGAIAQRGRATSRRDGQNYDDDEGDAFETYDVAEDATDSWTNAHALSRRPSRSMFVEEVLQAIDSDDPKLFISEQNSNRVVYTVEIGHVGHYMGNPALSLDDPIQKERLIDAVGWDSSWKAGYNTWHIMEFGTASKSTTFVIQGIARTPYALRVHDTGESGSKRWQIDYHPGRRGRHMFIQENGAIYEQDVLTAKTILEELKNDLIEGIRNGQ